MKKQTYELWTQFREELIEKNIISDLFNEFDSTMTKEIITYKKNNARNAKYITEKRKTDPDYARTINIK